MSEKECPGEPPPAGGLGGPVESASAEPGRCSELIHTPMTPQERCDSAAQQNGKRVAASPLSDQASSTPEREMDENRRLKAPRKRRCGFGGTKAVPLPQTSVATSSESTEEGDGTQAKFFAMDQVISGIENLKTMAKKFQ